MLSEFTSFFCMGLFSARKKVRSPLSLSFRLGVREGEGSNGKV